MTWQGEFRTDIDELVLFTKYTDDTYDNENIFQVRIAFMPRTNCKNILSAWLNIKTGIWGAYTPICKLKFVEKSIEYTESIESTINIADVDLQKELYGVKLIFPVGGIGPQGSKGMINHKKLVKLEGFNDDVLKASKEEDIRQFFLINWIF